MTTIVRNTLRGRGRALQRGFTLLELLIVMVVVTILTAIAISAYTEQVHKSRRANALNILGQVQINLERWRAENPYYCNSNVTVSGYTCPTFNTSGTFPYTSNPTDSYYTIAITYAASQPFYTVTATPISTSAQKNDRCGALCVYSPGATATTTCGVGTPLYATSSCN
jgi:type IV pilus assembly protein PilE